MAGRIPELKDLEAVLADSTDETSCRNAFGEYQKRGGGHIESAAEALRRRLEAINGPQETFTKEGWTEKPAGVAKALGAALSVGKSLVTSASSHPSEPLPATPAGSKAPALLPSVNAESMRAAVKAWDEMVSACVRPEDVVLIDGHDYWKVTAWRRIAMAYQVEVRQLHKMSMSADSAHDGTPSAEVELRLSAPNGRSVETTGLCHGREKRFRKKDGSWQDASEHVIVSLAWTRAFCRGMRSLIGFGEPSAEEVE